MFCLLCEIPQLSYELHYLFIYHFACFYLYKMKYTLTLATLLLTFFVGRSQVNLVSNGGFEQYNTCPNAFSQLAYCNGWDQPTQGTSDYFNTCANPNATVGVPVNFAGFQQPYQGNAYAGFYNYGNGYREYARGTLTPLVIGETYQVTIHIVKANYTDSYSDGFAVFFYQNGIGAPLNNWAPLPVTPQVDYGAAYGVITDTLNWTTMTATFTADSAYDHVIVGNFRDDANTNYSGPQGQYAYYYLDSVEVISATFHATPSHTNVSCFGGNDGTASVTPSNGTAPYTYLWTPGNQTTQSITGLTAGSYTCRVIDAAQDTVRDTIVITQPPALAATTSQVNVSCNGGNNGSATVNVTGGTPGYTYSWAPTGGTNPTASNLSANTYTCTITDANNCTLQKVFTITQAGSLAATTSQVNILCNGAATGSATVNVSGGTIPYTYLWAPSGGTNPTASGLVAGNYTCTITDFNNCTLQKSFTLTQPAAPLSATTTQTNISCNGANDGAASVTVSGGTPGYTYSWSPSGGNAASATGLAPGAYVCTITDANGCVLTKNFTITQPAVLSATISHTDVTCHGAGDGTATVVVSGGTLAYTYSWAPSGGNNATANNLTAGTYTCTITDAHGCTTTQSAVIVEPGANLSITPSQANVTCNGAHTGLATAMVSGGTMPYSYSWLPTGGNAPNAYNLAAGVYTVTVTDAHNCTTSQEYTITEGPAMVAAISHADILCHGGNNGIATVLAAGGTAPYAYSWAPTGGTGPNATGLPAGIYTCTITDYNNCTHDEVITITEPLPITWADSQLDVKCYGDSSGYAQVIISGGTLPYTYSWSPAGGNTNAAAGLKAGTYICTIQDYNSCIKTDTFDIKEPEKLIAQVTKTNVVCQGQMNTGVAKAIGTGGVGPYTYLWTPGNSTDTMLTGLGIGMDTCIITDSNGCVYNVVFNIVDTSQPFNYTIKDSATDCRSALLTAVPDPGSNQAVSYAWSFPGDTAIAISNPATHTYPQDGAESADLVIVNAVGCHDTLSHNFNISKPMIADYSFEPDPPSPNTPVHFHNLSSPYATIFNWDFGDGTSSTAENPDKLYNDSGLYNICLIAVNEHNCIDTACKSIKMDVDKVVGVPSAFTPNGDGENDVLYIRGFRLGKVKLRVYNRWGQVIFETDNKAKGWDGTYKGHPQPAEVYAYTLEATFTDGTAKQINGSISLLR